MRLITELAAESGIAAIINIHDVALATTFAERIVGLRVGEIVYDGDAQGLSHDVLTTIYGEEDWTMTLKDNQSSDNQTSNNQTSNNQTSNNQTSDNQSSDNPPMSQPPVGQAGELT
jgi:ABC-type phosphate/phosphonate transport system ATPase subunit